MKNTLLLKEIKTLLNNNYQGIIDKVILFGSHAKERCNKNSDYDILIILNAKYDWKLENKIIDTCYEIDVKYNILTDIKITSNEELKTNIGQQPFIQNAIKYGIAV